jgi:hypothetical protein
MNWRMQATGADIIRLACAALTVADAGVGRFGSGIFNAMASASARSLRWAMVRGVPAMVWRRLTRG